MHGAFQDQRGMFSHLSQEKRGPADHLLRKIRDLVRTVFVDIKPGAGHTRKKSGAKM